MLTVIILVNVILIGLFIVYFGLVKVHEGTEVIIERFGKYKRTLKPGLRLNIPLIDEIVAKYEIKTLTINIPSQEVLTKDPAPITIDGVIMIKPKDIYKMQYDVKDYKNAIIKLITTNIRSIASQKTLSEVMESRELIKDELEKVTHEKVLSDWGIDIETIRIETIEPTPEMKRALEDQTIAAKKRAATETAAIAKAKAQNIIADSISKAIDTISSQNNLEPKIVANMLNDREFFNKYSELAKSNNSSLVFFPDPESAKNKMAYKTPDLDK